MTAENWERIEELLGEAVELPAAERIPFLQKECRGDEELLSELLSLLEAHQRTMPAGFGAVRSILTALESEYHVGRTLGPYEIQGFLGRGGMGLVYKAQETGTGRIVALKLFSAEVEYRKSLRRECAAMMAVRHSNIVEVIGFGEQDGTAWLAMEYVEGQTLAKRLQRGPLSGDSLDNVALQIAEGLAAAHDAGIVHGDMKPGNVMLDEQAQVKILDFGLSRWVTGVANESTRRF